MRIQNHLRNEGGTKFQLFLHGLEGANDDEAIAVVAANVAEDDGMKNVRSAFRKRLARIDYQQKGSRK